MSPRFRSYLNRLQTIAANFSFRIPSRSLFSIFFSKLYDYYFHKYFTHWRLNFTLSSLMKYLYKFNIHLSLGYKKFHGDKNNAQPVKSTIRGVFKSLGKFSFVKQIVTRENSSGTRGCEHQYVSFSHIQFLLQFIKVW